MFQALPMALVTQLRAAHFHFHNPATSDATGNALVGDMLSEFRQHDPNISVWDLLPLFDAKEIAS